MAAKKKTTLKDIADLANVSVSTVSRIFNNKDIVSDELVNTVMEAARELNYDFSSSSRKSARVVGSDTCKVGILLGNIRNEAMGSILEGILSVTDDYDVEVLIADHKYSVDLQKTAMEKMVRHDVDAVIAVTLSDKNIDTVFAPYAREGLPIVVIARDATNIVQDDMSLLSIDSTGGILTGIRYLRELGHKRTLFLTGNEGDAMPEALRRYSIMSGEVIPQELIVRCQHSFSSAYTAVQGLLRGVSGKAADFTSVFAFSDVIALGARKALRDAGYLVPEDISIVGYDGLRAAEYMDLTTVAEPLRTMGSNAAFLLMNSLNSRQYKPKTMILPCSLQIRGSCCASKDLLKN